MALEKDTEIIYIDRNLKVNPVLLYCARFFIETITPFLG